MIRSLRHLTKSVIQYKSSLLRPTLPSLFLRPLYVSAVQRMPVAPVDDRGTKLFYTDSGALKSPTYKTLIIVHGYSWHSGTLSV